MNPSYLHHAFGVRHQKCTKTEYKGNQNIHYIEIREEKLYYPKCKSCKVVFSDCIYVEACEVSLSDIEKRFFA